MWLFALFFSIIILQNWRAQGQLVDSLVKQFEAELADTKKQIASVNLERKLQQTAAGKIWRKTMFLGRDQGRIR